MSDLFHESIPFDFLARVFAVMHVTPQHTYQILTKRPKQAQKFFEWMKTAMPDERPFRELFPNVWLGVSVESQSEMWRVPELFRTPAAVRFVSAEPLLDALDFTHIALGNNVYMNALTGVITLAKMDETFILCSFPPMQGLDWLVVGGESGASARPCEMGWIENIVEQCRNAGVPVFVKQLGTVLAKTQQGADKKGGNIECFPDHLQVREYPR